jgi:Ca-activated chloride channel family protein
MKKNETENKVELQINADKQVIARDKDCTRILEISVTPPQNDNQKERAPLNLSLVLDRSGSMQGEKLHFVKQAAAHVVDLLGEKDRTSVTIYDDQIETIFPSEFMTFENKTRAKTQIQTAHSGGSTNLSGGWLRGCEEAAKAAKESTINRTLLLTDGLANVGIVSIDELSTHSRELFSRGIATSCFGVGNGYDEHLLESISNSGGGNFHFLETLNAIPLVFEREFEELVNISMRDTELCVQMPTGVKAEVSAGWHAEMVNDRFNVSLGSLYSGKKQTIYLKLHFENNLEGSEITLVTTVRGKGEGENLCEAKKSFTFEIVPSKEEDAAEQDHSLMERFALVDMADRANEALKRERSGDRVGASNLMSRSVRDHTANMSPGMINKYKHMTNEMSAGMSEDIRKRHHQEEYENKRGRDIVRDYRLELVNGHLVASIDGLSVLIDTGIPVSVSDRAEWYFLHEVYQLPQEYMGVTLDYLSKMVGTRIDLLLGCDILKKYHVTLDLFGHRISFSSRPLFISKNRIPMTNFMGVPGASITIEGNNYPVFIDSGAKLSYVDQKIASHYTPTGKEKDFYPGMGEFETSVFEIPFQLGLMNFNLRCGVLPPLLEKTLFVTGNCGIIGSELYQKYQVDLAFPENAIYLKQPE